MAGTGPERSVLPAGRLDCCFQVYLDRGQRTEACRDDPEESLIFVDAGLATCLQSLQASWLLHLQFLQASLLRLPRILIPLQWQLR